MSLTLDVPDGFSGVGPNETWRLERFEHDLSELRGDMKAGLREVNTSVSNLQSAIQGLQVSMPLTYVTRLDFAERLKAAEESAMLRLKALDDACRQRDDSGRKQIEDMQTTIRQLIFAIIGALITGGLALLAEVFRLLGGAHG